MQDFDEIVQTIDRLQIELEDLTVRGLRTAGTAHLASLQGLREEFERIGAGHLAGRIATVIEAIRNDDLGAAAALLRTQASLRVFERILTLEAAPLMFQPVPDADDSEAAEVDDEDEP